MKDLTIEGVINYGGIFFIFSGRRKDRDESYLVFCRDYYRKYDWGSIDVPVTDKPAQF